MYVDERYANTVNRRFRWVQTLILVGAAVLFAAKLSGSPIPWWLVVGGPLLASVVAAGARGWIHGTRSIRGHRER